MSRPRLCEKPKAFPHRRHNKRHCAAEAQSRWADEFIESPENTARVSFSSMKTYTAVVERSPETGLFVGFIPGFPGAHTQAESLDELNANLREVFGMLLEDGEPQIEAEFVGTQLIQDAGRDISPNLLRKIIEDIRLAPEEFLKPL